MFGGDFADMCAEQFPLMLFGVMSNTDGEQDPQCHECKFELENIVAYII